MNSQSKAQLGPVQGLVARALSVWWVVAATAASVALFAFPLYKGVVLGLVPVLVGAAIVLGARKLPAAATGTFTRWLYESSPAAFLGVVLLAGLALRAVAVAFPPVPVSDHQTYLSYGMSVASGRGFGDLIAWPPGQPAVVALAIWLVGENIHALAAFHAALGLITVAVLYLGLRKYSEPAARWGSAVAAVWPSIVLWNSTLGHETTASLLFIVIALLVLSLSEDTSRSRWLVCLAIGLLTGAMALVRPTALAIPFLIAVAVWLRGAPLWRAGLQAAVIALVAAAVIAPWTWRNYQQFDEFCPISANAGNVLLSSNHPESDGIYHSLPHMPDLKPCERDRVRSKQAVAAIRADPVRFVALSVKRIAFMWGTDTSVLDFVLGQPPRGGEGAKKALSFLLQVPWTMLAIAWLIAAWKRGASAEHRSPVDWSFVLLWTALLWLVHALVEPLSRHHLPLIPLIAAIVLPTYWQWVTGTRGVAPPLAFNAKTETREGP